MNLGNGIEVWMMVMSVVNDVEIHGKVKFIVCIRGTGDVIRIRGVHLRHWDVDFRCVLIPRVKLLEQRISYSNHSKDKIKISNSEKNIWYSHCN